MNSTPAVTQFSVNSDPVAAGSTPTYGGVLRDGKGNPVGLGSLTAFTLSITDDATGAVVNNCSQANILNTGRGTLDAQGNFTVTLLAADTVFLGQSGAVDRRSLTLDYQYPGPGGITLTGRKCVVLPIVAMPGL